MGLFKDKLVMFSSKDKNIAVAFIAKVYSSNWDFSEENCEICGHRPSF
jgi:hypothetical protein